MDKKTSFLNFSEENQNDNILSNTELTKERMKKIRVFRQGKQYMDPSQKAIQARQVEAGHRKIQGE